MSEQTEREMILAVQDKGAMGKLGTYVKLSGPGWLQSAITLGGGSLAGALFLGVIGGYSMLWVQVLAMIFGVTMLCAISYVTLSTEDTPFQGIRKHINPTLAWGWLIASLMANMVWVLPQYSLAYGAVTQNLAPNLFENPDAISSKMTVTIIVFIIVTAVTFCYGGKGLGIKIYEWILKITVACIVLSFIGVVIKMSSSLPWGEIWKGFLPNFSLLNNPVPEIKAALEKIPSEAARAFWTGEVLSAQRDRMVAAASAAVGINMTFLLPYSMLAKKWTKEFRGLAIFDLSTGMVVPFVLAVSCVVIASAASFHAQPYEGLLVEQEGKLMLNEASGKAKDFNASIARRNAHEEGAIAEVPIDDTEKNVAAMLMKRDTRQFAQSLLKLTGSNAVSNKIFGFGVLAMALSTISLLMLISGFVVCEIGGFEHGGKAHRLGTLCAATGLLWPFLWTGTSKAYLAIPTSVFGYMLLPIAFLTFFLMMNSKRLLGENRPRGTSRIVWNVLMGVSLAVTGWASIVTGWGKTLKIGKEPDVTVIPFGKIAIIAFLIAIVLGHFYLKMKHQKEEGSS